MMLQATPVGYNLGPEEQIPIGEGRTVRVRGFQIAVFRTRSGELYATQAACPHKEGPLADGIIGSGKLVCPLHGYRFNLASGEPIGNECQALLTYPIRIAENGDILLEVP